MNHFVPDFDADDDYLNVVNTNSSSSSFNLPTKPISGRQGNDNDLMELLWQNGQVVMQNQRPNNTNTNKPSSPPPQQPLDQNLFIQEDEMTSWLHYSDLLFSSTASATSDAPSPATTSLTQVTAARPPVPTEIESRPPSVRPPVRNFMNFSRLRGNFSTPSISKAIVRESTQVNPSATPSDSGLTRRTEGIDSRGSAVAEKGKAVAIEIPGTSSSVASMEPVNVEPMIFDDDRKRKERDESEETKQGRGSTSSSTKRSRAAQVHNLSERKRRDRINERMKALQELIPRCNKSDKASMLDEAIEYMKSLQLQIQMMSMGCGVMPMMYPGMQQYMAMGMGMNPSLPPPSFMPFPNMLPAQRPLPMQQTPMGVGSVFSGPRYPLHASDPTSSQPQYSGFTDPYQQFRNLHPSQPPQFQSQASSSRVSSCKEPEDQGNNTIG